MTSDKTCCNFKSKLRTDVAISHRYIFAYHVTVTHSVVYNKQLVSPFSVKTAPAPAYSFRPPTLSS